MLCVNVRMVILKKRKPTVPGAAQCLIECAAHQSPLERLRDGMSGVTCADHLFIKAVPNYNMHRQRLGGFGSLLALRVVMSRCWGFGGEQMRERVIRQLFLPLSSVEVPSVCLS